MSTEKNYPKYISIKSEKIFSGSCNCEHELYFSEKTSINSERVLLSDTARADLRTPLSLQVCVSLDIEF